MRICLVDGCDRVQYAKGYCHKHYERFKNTGSPTSYSHRDPNDLIDNGNGTHSIILRDKQGNYKNSTIIDSFNLLIVKKYKWSLAVTGYAGANTCKNGNRSRVLLHQVIFNVEDGFLVDHIDRDKLNNRISNLRQVNRGQNRINTGIRSNNTSGVIGVSYRKDTHKWYSRIRLGKNTYQLGSYPEKEKAIIARLFAEKNIFKEYSPQQHLFERYGV